MTKKSFQGREVYEVETKKAMLRRRSPNSEVSTSDMLKWYEYIIYPMIILSTFTVIFLIILNILVIFEGYVYNEEVECPHLLCRFKDNTDSVSITNRIITSEQIETCFLNGIKINCSSIDKEFT